MERELEMEMKNKKKKKVEGLASNLVRKIKSLLGLVPSSCFHTR